MRVGAADASPPLAMRRRASITVTTAAATTSTAVMTGSPGRLRRQRPSPVAVGAGAPAVWTAPDWATYPVIENFYGRAAPRRPRVSSFEDVMSSPTDRVPTTTLGETCSGYEDRGEEVEAERRRPTAGSFAYSCSTDTSEDALALAAASALAAAGSYSHPLEDRFDRAKPWVASTSPAWREREVRAKPSGYSAWDRMRRSAAGEFMPVPYAAGDCGAALLDLHDQNERERRRRTMENPQAGSGGELSPAASSSDADSASGPHHAPSSSRLRYKLHESLLEIDARLATEHALSRRARLMLKKTAPPPPNAMWSLLCGARASSHAPSDGLAFLYERLAVAVHHRALNQLQRHRRHVDGILQIVASRNPDLELTERQLDSFESADAMLGHDIKYSLLRKQVEVLGARLLRRKDATVDAKLKNGANCFDVPRVKNAMLRKLLEAVSWYRLVQLNSREESASSSVAAPPSTSSLEGALSERSGSTMSSITSTTRQLQELQVEKILNVLAGEDFYSDYNELMCHPDWWEIAQAHFENLIFSSTDSRVCQWMHQMSRDVAAVSEEDREDEYLTRNPVQVTADARNSAVHHRQAEWLKDPPPEQIIDFIDRLTQRIRREFDVDNDVSKSLNAFIQRTVYSRVAVLCFNQRATRDCQRKDKLWRKKVLELSAIPMENLGVPSDVADKIRSQLPSRRISKSRRQRVYLVRAIEAFNGMTSVVPCDLLDELMHGVVILHHEAALVLGTTQFSVETFFPLLAYVLLHCHLPLIHAQLHLLENFAITNANANGEEAYYVYCVHAAVEYVCNTANLSTTPSSQANESCAPPVAPIAAVVAAAAAIGSADVQLHAVGCDSKRAADAVHPEDADISTAERSSLV